MINKNIKKFKSLLSKSKCIICFVFLVVSIISTTIALDTKPKITQKQENKIIEEYLLDMLETSGQDARTDEVATYQAIVIQSLLIGIRSAED